MLKNKSPLFIQILAIGAVLLAITFAMSLNMAVRYAVDHNVAQEMVLLVRFLGGMIVLLPLIIYYGKDAVSTKKPLIQTIYGVMIAVAIVLFFYTIRVMPLAVATTLQSMAPLFIPVGAFFILKERMPIVAFIPLTLSFIGAALTSDMTLAGGSLIPIMLGLLSAFLGGAQISVAKYLLDYTTKLSLMVWAGCIGFIASLIWVLISGAALPPLMPFIALSLAGAVGYIAWILMIWAYEHVNSAQYAPLRYLAIPLNVLFAWILFDEIPAPIKLIGITIILGASLMTLWWPSDTTKVQKRDL